MLRPTSTPLNTSEHLPAANRRALGWLLSSLAVLALLALGLVSVALIGFGLGRPGVFLLALLVSVAPLPIYVALTLWIDRFEAEPGRLLLLAFLWGASAAPLMSGVVNQLNAFVGGDLYAAVVSAPVFEEAFKGLFLVAVYLLWRREFDGVVDGVIYAMMVGLGFAVTENIQYYGRAAMQDTSPGELNLQMLGITFWMRGIMSPFLHPLATSLTGIGFGLARQAKSRLVQTVAPAAGFIGAVGLHALWNVLASNSSLFLVSYVLIMVPTFLLFLGLLFFSLRREGRLIAAHLTPELRTGVVSPAELREICNLYGRTISTPRILQNEGLRGWLARRRFDQIACELALYRYWTARGLAEPEPSIEKGYVEQLQTLRSELTGKIRRSEQS